MLTPVKMHADQIDLSTDTVAALVATHLPHHAGLPLRPVTSHGTVNALYRLGDDLVLRFPLQPGTTRDTLAAEQHHTRRVAPHVPVAVPEPVTLGEPGEGYHSHWTAYRWIPGDTPDPHTAAHDTTLARDLTAFAHALHRIDTDGRTWDRHSRGGPLPTREEHVRDSLRAAHRLTDTRRLAQIWADSRDAPAHDGPDVWIHADLMPGNLILRDGRLAAVIDWGAFAGDPAVDLMPAWNLFGAHARGVYRDALGAGDAMWARGRGWAIVQAIGALPYYVDTNPVMARTARRTLAAVIEDAC
jgi:aminoglycoside phosphotransferase (APT) family kinase protein